MYNSIMATIDSIEALDRLALGRLSRIESVILDNDRTDQEKIEVITRLLNISTSFNTEKLMNSSDFNILELRTMIEILNEKVDKDKSKLSLD